MPITSFKLALQKSMESAHTPAVAYAYIEAKEKDKRRFISRSVSIALGEKNAQPLEVKNNIVDNNTLFPASSLSKIVFTYLILQLVHKKQISLDEPLHGILEYERFKLNDTYPQKAMALTARHVLSHTTGLPNWHEDPSSQLIFSPKSDLGEGYSYSGEAFLYLQKVIEKKMNKDLEALAKEYVFDPLKMHHSTFLRQAENESNIVEVHTHLGKPTAIYKITPEAHAAASLLTTADDFSKLMSAWLEHMDDPILKQAFEPRSAYNIAQTCGLGWHIYKNHDELIAYQWGANPNTRSFVAINLNDKKAATFFTNSENGMSLANAILNSSDLPSVGDMRTLFQYMGFSQSDEPGWQETLKGNVAQDQGKFEEATAYFEKARELRRSEWLDILNQNTSPEKAVFISSLDLFVGNYQPDIAIFMRNHTLILKDGDIETKLVRISETEFLPEGDLTFKITFKPDLLQRLSLAGDQTLLFKDIEQKTAPLDPSSLELARILMQKYKDAVSNAKLDSPACESHHSPSPFQKTPKPSSQE